MNTLPLARLFVTVALLTAACSASCAEPQQVRASVPPPLPARACSMSIQITKDKRDIVRTRVADGLAQILEIQNDDRVGLWRHIQTACQAGQQPSVSILADASTPFQSLVNVIVAMPPARVASFEISADKQRLAMRIPAHRPQAGQTEINLNITSQGTYAINAEKIFKPLNVQALSGLLRTQISRKNCCFVIINADAKLPVIAFLDAVAAIELAGIDDYWIRAANHDNAKKVDSQEVLEERIRSLENEQKRLLRAAKKKSAN